MTQDLKDLLLKDLSARLPYGVVVAEFDENGRRTSIELPLVCIENDFSMYGNVKPYLFPLSSITEEQKKEISKRYNYHDSYGLCIEITNHSEGYWDDDNPCHLQDYLWLVDWYNKNHFDYRNLIGQNLAIDCTNLNIY